MSRPLSLTYKIKPDFMNQLLINYFVNLSSKDHKGYSLTMGKNIGQSSYGKYFDFLYNCILYNTSYIDSHY